MNYRGFKVRFARLYDWIEREKLPSKIRETDKLYSEICKQFIEHLPKIEENSSNGFKFEGSIVERVEGRYGPFIKFPRATSTISVSKYKIPIVIIIRINPCMDYSFDVYDKHHSKIWANIHNTEEFKVDGETIQEILHETREYCKEITSIVGQEYSVTCGNVPKVYNYWISIESVVMTNEDAQRKGTEALFITDDKERFKQLLKKYPDTKSTLSDIVGWLYDKRVRNPLDYILAESTKKDLDLEWKVRVNADAEVFYSQRNTDSFFQIVALGKVKSPNEDILSVDRLFLPAVSSLVTVL